MTRDDRPQNSFMFTTCFRAFAPLNSVLTRPLPLGRVGRTSRTLLLGSTLGFATLAPFSPLAPLFPLAPSLAGQLNCEEAQGAQPQDPVIWVVFLMRMGAGQNTQQMRR